MSGRYLWHVTLNTGESHRSYRNEVRDAIMTLLRQQIDEALAGLDVAIKPGYRLKADTVGGALVGTVMRDRDDPLCTIAVARNARQGAAIWRLLQEAGSPPRSPWCAVRLYAGLAYDPDALIWLGDFERCLAWAWLDGRADSAKPDAG